MRQKPTVLIAITFLLIEGSLMLSAPSFARLEEQRPVYPVVCTSNPLSRGIQQAFGINTLASWIGARVLKHQLEEKFQGALDVHIKPFSGLDLMAGKAQQVTIAGRDILYDRLLPISTLDVQTDQETPLYLLMTPQRTAMLRPVRTNITAVLTEGDLTQLFRTEKGKKRLAQTAVDLPPFGKQQIDFHTPRVHLEDGKVIFESVMNVTGASEDKALPIRVEGTVIADKKHTAITLDNIQILLDGRPAPPSMAGMVEDAFGELADFSHVKLKGHRVAVALEDPVVQANQLILKGSVMVAPIPRVLVKVETEESPALKPVGTQPSTGTNGPK